MKNCYFYLDGMPLIIAALIFAMVIICGIFVAMHYVDLIRENSELKQANRLYKADLNAAEMELEGLKLRGICPYKLEPKGDKDDV